MVRFGSVGVVTRYHSITALDQAGLRFDSSTDCHVYDLRIEPFLLHDDIFIVGKGIIIFLLKKNDVV